MSGAVYLPCSYNYFIVKKEEIKMTDSQLRNLAKNQNLIIRKSRTVMSINNQGGYMIVNALTNVIEAGENFNMSAADVENYLTENERGI